VEELGIGEPVAEVDDEPGSPLVVAPELVPRLALDVAVAVELAWPSETR
jgi:hypothetical protein